ncbi:unannotated protein [freshwater metagenome]|uniref:Unannotated protein n=1 Tax=freshwater metagenome TaxID=449393 RepID=A0A6J7J3U4_9ZZZZ|nr:PAS domain S-box protein [Actinomycetota bacterium]
MTAPVDGRAGTAPRHEAELLRLLGEPGDVPLRVWPVADHERLSRLIALLTRIDGVAAVGVQRFDGHDALLVAHVGHPASADEVLTARLARGIVGCALVDGRVHVQLVPRSTGAPAPPGAGPVHVLDVPPGLRALRVTAPPHGPVRPREDDARRPAPGPRGPVTGRTGADDDGGPQAVRLVDLALRSILGRSLLVCDTAMRVLSVAGAAWPQAGAGPTDAGVRDVLDPGTWRTLSPALLTALSGGSEVVEFDGPGGTRFEATCTPVVDDGVVIGATAVARDIAAERGERAAIGVLRGEFDAVFEHSPVGQGLLSIEGRWIRVNARLCELLGATAEELLGEEASGWLHPDGRSWHVERYRELLTGLRPGERATFRVLGARGHESAVSAHVAVLRTPDGWPRGAIVQIVRVADA